MFAKMEFCSVGYRFNHTTFTRVGLTGICKVSRGFPKKSGGEKLKIVFQERILLNGKQIFDFISMSKLYKATEGEKH